MLGFLLVDDADFASTRRGRPRCSARRPAPVLEAAVAVLEALAGLDDRGRSRRRCGRR